MTTRARQILATLLEIGDPLVERGADGLPTAFRIWRAGENPTSKGLHVFTPRSAELLMSDQAERGNLYSVDVDHLSLSPTAPPESRKAVGWHRLEVRDAEGGPELWATSCEWTDVVADGLRKRPPEWRYFSPAYAVAPDSGEIVAYMNTAITNTPATFNVTALASETANQKKGSQKMDELQKAYAALAAAKEAGDEEGMKAARKAARAAHAKMAAEIGGDEPDGDEAPAKSSDDPEEKAEKSSEDPPAKKDEAASIAASAVTTEAFKALADVVAEIATDLKADKAAKEAAERKQILASRPDLPEKIVKLVKSAPLSVARTVVEAIPSTLPANKHAAAIGVTATRGEQQGAAASAPAGEGLPAAEREQLAEAMGLRKPDLKPTRVGVTATFPAMSADECKRFITAKQEAAKAKTATK